MSSRERARRELINNLAVDQADIEARARAAQATTPANVRGQAPGTVPPPANMVPAKRPMRARSK
jgi:hypothetical protein